MHSPIKIHIHKKTLVSTKRQIRHDERSDWKKICVISYQKSEELFFEIGGGPIRTDADFAKALFDSFGDGYYSCIFWRKGVKGFRKFINVACGVDGYFMQFKAAVYKNRKKRNKIEDYEYVKMLYMQETEFDEKNLLWEKLRKLENAIESSSDNTSLPFPYLKSLQPRYKPHGYNDSYVGREKEVIVKPKIEQEEGLSGFW